MTNQKAEGGRRKAEGKPSDTATDAPPRDLVERTKSLALRVQRLCRALPNAPEALAIRRQLARSATSIAANYRAAQRARSKPELLAKLGIVEEESDETVFWLEMVVSDALLPARRVQPLLQEANEIVSILVTCIRKGRQKPAAVKSASSAADPSAFRLPPSAFPRVGHGFDLHRLEPGLPLVVGGVKLEHDRGCAAHSDGDVVYHAVTDAVLGALGQDDIGQLFPDNDPKWKNADSWIFVEAAAKRMRDAGYAIGNLDVTVILQRPRLSPHKQAVRANLAGLLGCAVSQVNIKGKTHEQVDALGENRAIACHVVVLLAPAGGAAK